MENRPLVSIVINNYNYAQFLDEAIASALNQTYTNVEVILVDDGSTDNSPEIIAKYSDRLTAIFKQNGGQGSAFNAGFPVSRGEIVCFLDSDDIFLPHKVAEIVNIFTAHADIDWCFHSVKLEDRKTGAFLGASMETGSHKCDYRASIRQGKLNFAAPPTSALCFKRSVLESILPMPEAFKRGADRYLVAITPALSKGFFLDRKLVLQGIHGDNGNTLQKGGLFNRRRAYKAIAVAYYMKNKLPQCRRFTNRMFARGLANYWSNNHKDPDAIKIVRKYFQNLSFADKIFVWLMSCCFYLFKNLPKVKPNLNINHSSLIEHKVKKC